jgi:hypothetical protein
MLNSLASSYSPNLVEGKFCELRGDGVLGSTHADEVCEEVLKALEETEG